MRDVEGITVETLLSHIGSSGLRKEAILLSVKPKGGTEELVNLVRVTKITLGQRGSASATTTL